jgi:methylmalonyl-CoA/ethylmalonyl-CoA epimerase
MIEGIEHIGIAVRSIEEARGFWEALGLVVDHVEEVPQEGVRVAMIPCGAARIELLEPTRPDSPIAAFLEKRGPGIHHLCLKSGDVLADDAALRAAGVTLLRERPTRGAGGVLVELAQPAAEP